MEHEDFRSFRYDFMRLLYALFLMFNFFTGENMLPFVNRAENKSAEDLK